MLRGRKDRGLQDFAISLAVNGRPAVKSARADVLQQVWNFRKRPPLAVLRQVELANVLWVIGDRLCGRSPCFVITDVLYAKSIYNAKMPLIQDVG